jgi:uncharacterized protein (UPF0147 family)
MVKKESVTTESEPWNVAKSYSGGFVLLPLIECRRLITIALFGVEDISVDISDYIKIENKIDAIKKLLEELKQICDDTYFTMNIRNKEVMDDIKKKLENVEEVIEGVSSESVDQRTQTVEITINKKHFSLCLKTLREIFRDIKIPLNNEKLIFPSSDDLDLEKLKQSIIEGG